ncbi:MAG: iron-containing alcohol dehydrogenase [Thermoplasmatota archaeon]
MYKKANVNKKMNFEKLPKLIFGHETISEIPEQIKRLGRKNPLIVTDSGIVKHTDIIDNINQEINETDIKNPDIYGELSSEPTFESVSNAVDYGKKKDFDIILGIGGGSAMDTAKIVSIMKNNKKDIEHYVETQTFENPRLPLLLIPTTSGTGSEVTGDAIFSLNNETKWFSTSELIADVSIMDPGLTISMPPSVTASSGLDVLCHAIEGMMTTYSNNLIDELAIHAVKLSVENLEKAYNCSRDLESRYNMMIAATIGGIVNLNAPATLPHSVGYTLAHSHGLPHGLSCSVALPYVMGFNLVMCEEKFAKIATETMDINLKGKTQREKAIESIRYIQDLASRIEAPTTLKEIGVKEDELEELALECVNKYPRPYNICDINESKIKDLYINMYNGNLNLNGGGV